ncbi:uncharacterized protein BYT42DRAFT_347287 [Radiomyces spectabilis]|uniref:uncharacterized protein n=1 Tax=Radiomyces spectabilis TaxID=64574 RepID=UPI002220E526|nr:uncharacterized protein BYT42DRAFT_347287 [Radiomyces spectabilis]KAI8377523.1 hypothetical protein BYT42DRAFT_347287 [Radiomyces spectabilis]
MLRELEQDKARHAESDFVDDGRLSPLQLPPQIVRRSQNPSYFDRPMTPDSIAAGEYRGREQSYDSVSTIRPSECLEQRTSAPYASVQRSLRNLDRVDEESVHWKKDDGSVYLPDNDSVYQGTSPCHYLDDESALPIFRSESVLYLEDDHDNHSDLSSTSKVVLMKLPRNKNIAPTLIQRCSTRQTYVGSDEGYDDEDEDDLYGHHKEMPIDSDSVFLPISEQDQSPLVCRDTLRDSAATKIQAVWRGYQCRKTRPNVSKLVIDLVRVCDGIHRRHLHQTDTRVRQLEARLQEETAMRVAFEKAMEQMTVLVDQREKVLYDRIEQEVAMREAYERKMEYTLSQIQPLESNLKREVKARYEMESMLSRVLDQMQSIENARQQQAQDEAKARNVMQRQLDDALYQLAELKKQRKQQQDTPPAKIRAHEVGNKSTLSVASSVRPHTPSAAARPVSRLTARSTNKDVSPPATTVARPTTSMRHRPLQSTTARSLVQPKPLASATTVSTRASRASLRSPLTVRSTASRTDIRQGTMSTVKRTTAMVSSRG